MNILCAGFGDLPRPWDTEDDWIISEEMRRLQLLLRHWHLFSQAKSGLDDILSAARQADAMRANLI